MAIHDDVEVGTGTGQIKWLKLDPDKTEQLRKVFAKIVGPAHAKELGFLPRLSETVYAEHLAVLRATISKFPCLADWDISLSNAGYAGFCETMPNREECKRQAVVHPAPPGFDDAFALSHYYLHEVLHIALLAVEREHDRNESLVCTLTSLISGL